MKKAIPIFALLIISFTAVAKYYFQDTQPESLPLEVHAIQGDPTQGAVVILLADQNQKLFLPMVIGGDQAISIYLAKKGEIPNRPLTHDLLTAVFSSIDANVEKIEITDLRDGVYYAEIQVKTPNQRFSLDSRPSDAIAIALRLDSPIYAQKQLLNSLDDAKPGVSISKINKLGLSIQGMTKSLARVFNHDNGVIITDVQVNSIAEAHGFAVGDLIVACNETPIESTPQLKKVVGQLNKGENALFEVLRAADRIEIEVLF